MPDLERMLTQHLRPVNAPDELWKRLNSPREPQGNRSRRSGARLAWAASIIVLVGSSAVGLHAHMKGPAAIGGPQANETVRFRAWVKSATGLDIHAACRLCHDGEEQMTAFN